MRPPNILLIHCDQHRFDCVGVNGHAQLRTPHLDALAAGGVNFTHAFTPTAICSPARASLLCGLWPTQHGCRSIPGTELYRPADRHLPVFSRLLQQAGYQLGWVGKYHREFDAVPAELGWDDYISEDAYRAWREAQGLPPVPQANGWFGEVDSAVTPEQTRLAWGADRILDFMARYQADGRPWVLRWDPSEPHLPCIPSAAYAAHYPPETVAPWPSFADDLAGKPYIQHQQRRTWRVDGWTWEQWAPVVARYLAVIEELDTQVGRLLAALERHGVAGDTLVIYSTDHGDLCGGHGMMDKHFVMYDDVMRVPFIARFPGRLPEGVSSPAFVLNELDTPVTLLAAAGIPVPPSFVGHSLFDIVAGQESAQRPDVYGMWQGGQFGLYTQRMVRTREWKYIWNTTAEDELYDLRQDPGELVNRATDPACAETLGALRQRLLEHMRQINDPLLNPWNRDQLANGLTV